MKLVVMVSGSGSNLQAILDAIAAGTLDAEVLAVVSNRRRAKALERAERADVSTAYAPLKPYRDEGRPREDYDRDLAELVRSFDADVIVLAGWMHVLSSAFLDGFDIPVLNLHPALPGDLPGTDAIRRAWEEGAQAQRTRTGVMVHEVVPEVDAGPTLGSVEVPLVPGEPLEALEARMHAAEHALLVDVLRAMSAERRGDAAEA